MSAPERAASATVAFTSSASACIKGRATWRRSSAPRKIWPKPTTAIPSAYLSRPGTRSR